MSRWVVVKFEKNEFVQGQSNNNAKSNTDFIYLYNANDYTYHLNSPYCEESEIKGVEHLHVLLEFLNKVLFLMEMAPEVAKVKYFLSENMAGQTLKNIEMVKKGIATMDYLKAMEVKCWVEEF